MRIIALIFLFFSIFSFAQNTGLEIKIDSITFVDTNPSKRKFILYYHIENKSNNTVSLILNTNSIKSNTTNSLSWSPSYRLYQQNITIDTDNIFNTEESQKLIQKMISELKFNKGNLREYLLIEQKRIKEQTSKNIIGSIIKLNPKEIKNYAKTLDWDKNRYLKYFDNEYYLDEKTTHFIDLYVYLYKEELKEDLLSEDLKTITEDKTIAKGWLQSNKMEINFKE